MNPRDVLAECELFAPLAPSALDTLAAHASMLTLCGGARLCAVGEVSDAIYIVATGRLRVTGADGRLLGYAGRLEPVGEIGLLSGEARSANVHAMRDCRLIQLRRDELLAFLLQHPSALVAIARVVIQRLRQNHLTTQRQSARSARTYAVVPATPDADAATLAQGLASALSQLDCTRLLDAPSVDRAVADDEGSLVDWLNRVELDNRFLVYLGHAEPDPWTLRAVRQADRVLVAVPAHAAPAQTPMIAALKSAGLLAPLDLVLVSDDAAPAEAAEWKRVLGAHTHHYVAPRDPASHARLARQVSGHGIGLVLGGGGARGFAHIGLLRALAELDIPVDLFGGTSMGAFVAALSAAGYSPDEIQRIAHITFVERNHLNDYLWWPRGSLIRGRKFLNRLRDIFGERRIEDLRRNFFCVSTNLTRGEAERHDAGPLAAWIAASMSVPGFAPPTAWRGELLVDGAVVNSLPTDLMLALDRGPIIASDVSTEGGVRASGVEGPDIDALTDWRSPGEAPGLREILFRTATLTSESGVARRAAMADLYLRMPVGEIGLFDWKRIDEVVERGYRHAMNTLPAARAKLLA